MANWWENIPSSLGKTLDTLKTNIASTLPKTTDPIPSSYLKMIADRDATTATYENTLRSNTAFDSAESDAFSPNTNFNFSQPSTTTAQVSNSAANQVIPSLPTESLADRRARYAAMENPQYENYAQKAGSNALSEASWKSAGSPSNVSDAGTPYAGLGDRLSTAAAPLRNFNNTGAFEGARGGLDTALERGINTSYLDQLTDPNFTGQRSEGISLLRDYALGDSAVDRAMANRYLGKFDASSAAASLSQAQKIAANPYMSEGAKRAAVAELQRQSGSQRSELIAGLAEKAQERAFTATKEYANQTYGALLKKVETDADEFKAGIDTAIAKGNLTSEEWREKYSQAEALSTAAFREVEDTYNIKSKIVSDGFERDRLELDRMEAHSKISDTARTNFATAFSGLRTTLGRDITIDDLNGPQGAAAKLYLTQLYNSIKVNDPSMTVDFETFALGQMATIPSTAAISGQAFNDVVTNLMRENGWSKDYATKVASAQKQGGQGIASDNIGTYFIDPTTNKPIMGEDGKIQYVAKFGESGTPPSEGFVRKPFVNTENPAYESFAQTVPKGTTLPTEAEWKTDSFKTYDEYKNKITKTENDAKWKTFSEESIDYNIDLDRTRWEELGMPSASKYIELDNKLPSTSRIQTGMNTGSIDKLTNSDMTQLQKWIDGTETAPEWFKKPVNIFDTALKNSKTQGDLSKVLTPLKFQIVQLQNGTLITPTEINNKTYNVGGIGMPGVEVTFKTQDGRLITKFIPSSSSKNFEKLSIWDMNKYPSIDNKSLWMGEGI